MRCVETHTIKQSTPQRKGSLKIHPHSKRPANHETPPPLRHPRHPHHPAPRSRFNRPRGRLRQRAQRRTSLSGCLPPRGQTLPIRTRQPRLLRRKHRRAAARTHRRRCSAAYRKPHHRIWRLDICRRHAVQQGHTHQAFDGEQDGCRIIINPLGYSNEIGQNGYRNGLLLELPD